MARQADIPFERDQSTRFLPWIVAVMVFLAALAAAFAVAVGDSIESWDSTLTGRITIQVPIRPVGDAGTADNGTADNGTGNDGAASGGMAADRRAADIVRRLEAMPGIAHAAVLPDAAVRALLEPWLGLAPDPANAGDGLPLPRLIDVELTGAGLDATALRAALADVGPDIVLDDHRVWLGALIDLARLVEAVALLVLLLIAASAVAAVVFATRSGLAVHAPIIELLHLMGAHDAYVAEQFQAHAMRLGLRGGIVGSVAAIAVLGAIGWVARDIDAALLPAIAPTVGDALLLAAVPVAAIVIAMATARLTVLRALARMP
jgi:cell division transport system permease protein